MKYVLVDKGKKVCEYVAIEFQSEIRTINDGYAVDTACKINLNTNIDTNSDGITKTRNK